MKRHSDIYDFLLDSTHNKDYFALRKEMIVRIFLYIAASILTLFAAVNIFIYKQYTVGMIDIIAALVAFYALTKIKNKNTLSLAITISSLNLFFFFLFYLYFNQNQDFGIIWLIFLPIFIIPLNGHQKGVLISLVFYAIAFFIAYQGIGVWEDGAWNTHSFIRFVAASLVLVYITYVTELAIYKNNLELQKKEREKNRYLRKLEEMAQLDYLTKVYNRRHVSELLDKELHKVQRYHNQVCVAIIDIDFFKRVNDTYGHQKGDEILIQFTKILQENLRKSDIFGRWGGEEFIVIFPHTSLEDAKKKCEQLRQEVKKHMFDEIGTITCSIGVAEYKLTDMSFSKLIEEADNALYEAKEHGRDCVVAA